MIDMTCPSCGRAGRVPRDKVNTRLVCKKCNRVFHLTATGVPLLGEPPAVKTGAAQRPGREPSNATAGEKADWRAMLPEGGLNVSRRSLIIGVSALLILGGLYFYSNMPTETLEDKTKDVGYALAGNDIATIRGLASSNTAADAESWARGVHDLLERKRVSWTNKEVRTQGNVIEQNRRQSRGESMIVLFPDAATARNNQIASEADMGGPMSKNAIMISVYWTLDSLGKWHLDGGGCLKALAMTQ